MKQKFILFICFLTAMALIPVFGLRTGAGRSEKQNGSKEDDRIYKIIASVCDNEYSDKTLRAVARIVYNNISLGYTYKDCDCSDKELLSKVKSVCSKKPADIIIDGKQRYIPFSSCSNGNTKADGKYPYLTSVASPWDSFSSEYTDSAACVGVSIDGLDYLCENGFSSDQALKWYLPGMKG